tara:strand:- start:286 stop:519 length:234 start_codon:yes stop_codon:yes gene_type:complete
MEIKIRYFGQLTEIVGKNEENLSTDSKTFADLKEYLIKIYPDLKNYTFQIAQNNEIIGEKEIINNSQIDIFPPFSGG